MDIDYYTLEGPFKAFARTHLVEDRVEHEVHGHDVGGQPVALGALLGLLHKRDLLPPISGWPGGRLLTTEQCCDVLSMFVLSK